MASTIKGITVEINGNTTGLTEALKGVDKQINTTQKELKQVNQALKFDPKNTELLAQKQKLLADSISKTSEKLKTLKQAQEQAQAKGMDLNDEGYRELTREISKTTQALKGLETQQKNTNNAIKGMGFTEVGQGFNKFSGACDELSNKLKGLSTIGASVVASLTAITLSASANADDINTMAKKYNLSTKEIQQFQMASDLIDVDLNTITKSFNKLTMALANESKTSAEAFDKLGIATKNVDGTLRSSNDIFYETIEALSGIQDETEQDALAIKIFGKSASELGPLINGGTEQLKELNKYMEENNLLLGQGALDSLNATNDAYDTFKITIEGLKNSIASDFAPMIKSVLESVSKFVLGLKEKWEQLSPSIKKIIPVVASVVASLAPLLKIISMLTGAEGIGGLLTSIGAEGGLIGSLTSLMNPITLVLGGLALLFTASEDFRSSVMELVDTVISTVQPIFELVIGRLQELFNKIASFIIPILQQLGTFIATYIMPIVNSIVELVGAVLTPILNVVFDVLGFIVDVLTGLYGVLENVGIIDAFGKAFETVGNIINKVVGFVKSAVEWFTNLINKVKDFFSSGFEKVASFFGFGGGDLNLSNEVSGFQSGALRSVSNSRTIKLYNTFNITKANITQDDVKGWGLDMVDIINDKLGEAM